MEAKIAALENKVDELQRDRLRLAELDEKIAELNKIKEDFGTKLKDRLDLMEAEGKNRAEQMVMDLQKLFEDAKEKFTETDIKLEHLFQEAKNKFEYLEKKIEGDNGSNGKHGGHKKNGLLPDKMMIPKPFNEDVASWRKWKEDVSKYFDEELEGMKAVMDEVAKLHIPITKDILEQACVRNPTAVAEKLQRWKHLYRASTGFWKNSPKEKPER